MMLKIKLSEKLKAILVVFFLMKTGNVWKLIQNIIPSIKFKVEILNNSNIYGM